MFIGHFGVGFGAKKFAPAVSLGWLFIAAQFLDLLWPVLVMLGIEHVEISPGITKATPLDFTYYPYSHSLLMVLIWGVILGLTAYFLLKEKKYALVIFFCVISHWLLDLLVHRPDLPLTTGESLKVGLGLWDYPFISAILEGLIFFTGVYFYYRTTAAKNKLGKYGFLTMIILLVVIQAANIFGPPPPDVNAIAWAGQLQWLFVILAFMIDRNRYSKIKFIK